MLSSQSNLAINIFSSKLYKMTLRLSKSKIKILYHLKPPPSRDTELANPIVGAYLVDLVTRYKRLYP